MYTFPKPLRPGDTIAIVAPSAALADDDLQEGVDFIRSLGYDVKLGRSVGAHWGYLAGTDELRAQDIHEAFGDDGVSAVLCLRGGYGAARLLPLLDYDFIAAHPKLFMGFSDITALHTAFQQRCRMATAPWPCPWAIRRRTIRGSSLPRGCSRPFRRGPFPFPKELCWSLSYRAAFPVPCAAAT